MLLWLVKLARITEKLFQALKTEGNKAHSTIHNGQEARRQWMQEQLTQYSEKEFERLISGDARVLGTLRIGKNKFQALLIGNSSVSMMAGFITMLNYQLALH